MKREKKNKTHILEVVLLSRSLCYMFAGGHTLPQLRRGPGQACAELFSCSSLKSFICGGKK